MRVVLICDLLKFGMQGDLRRRHIDGVGRAVLVIIEFICPDAVILADIPDVLQPITRLRLRRDGDRRTLRRHLIIRGQLAVRHIIGDLYQILILIHIVELHTLGDRDLFTGQVGFVAVRPSRELLDSADFIGFAVSAFRKSVLRADDSRICSGADRVDKGDGRHLIDDIVEQRTFTDVLVIKMRLVELFIFTVITMHRMGLFCHVIGSVQMPARQNQNDVALLLALLDALVRSRVSDISFFLHLLVFSECLRRFRNAGKVHHCTYEM